jgi:hypothetical protein
MAKKPTKKSVPARNPAPLVYPIANTAIKPEQLYELPARMPKIDGPWRSEAGKIAWTDEATGLGCIILRRPDGALAGYVGIPPAHPLAGFEADAIAASTGVGVHGGLTYSRACDARGPEELRVCHVRSGDLADLWWLGFACNLPSDFVSTRDKADDERSGSKTYRTEGYVFEECTRLAAQLAALTNETGAGVEAGVSIDGPPSLLFQHQARGEVG